MQLSLKAIDALWAKAGRVTDPVALRRLLDDAVPALVRRYGGMAGTVAAEWYQAVRSLDGGAGDGFEALPSDVSGEALDRAAESARWAAQPLFDAKSADPRGEALSRVHEVVERHVRQAGQDTLARNAERDPRAARYAIVPTGARTCAWCVMLASRGGVYKSKASARGSVHAHCDCQALPDFGHGIKGYDPGRYYDLYEKAVADAGGYGASEEDVLAALRRNGGVSDSPQPPKAEAGSGGGGKPPRSGGGSGSGSSGGGNPPGSGNGHGSDSAGGGWRVPHSPNENRILSLRGCGDVTDEEWRRRQEAVGVPGSVEALYPQEIVFLEKFENLGNHVEWIPRDTERWKSTNDFRWIEQGEEFELKSMTGDKYKHIAGRISSAVRSAHENHGVIKDCFVVDIGGVEAKQKLIHQLERYNVNNAANGTAVRRLFLMDSTGLREIHLE